MDKSRIGKSQIEIDIVRYSKNRPRSSNPGKTLNECSLDFSINNDA